MTEGPSQDRPAEKDQIKPFHAREVSTGQETADVVAAVLKHAAERDEAAKKRTAPKPQPIWMLPLGLTLSVLAGFLLVAPPAWVVVNPIAAAPTEDQQARLRSAMWRYMNAIETYRLNNDRYPSTLADVGIAEGGVDYQLQGSSYILSSSIGEDVVVFNSAVDSAREWGQRVVGDLAGRIGG